MTALPHEKRTCSASATCRPTRCGASTPLRAVENFPLAGRPVHRELVHAYGAVKLACARTNHELGRWDDADVATPSSRPARR